MSEDLQQIEQKKIEQVAEKQNVEHTAPAQVVYKNRGGFMGGGSVTTVLFLLAFFLVSYWLGVVSAQNSKLIDSISAVPSVAPQAAGQAAQQGGQVGLQDYAKITSKIAIDDKRVKGDKNAKITIVEYSDFECPFCGKFYNESYKSIVEKYVNSGKVKIAFKDFPLSFHPQAQKAAEASRCALEQNKFWEMHDKLFENQKELSTENFKKWAGELGLAGNQFNQCLDTGKYAEAVKKDLAEGVALGVQGTPTFVINDTVLVGAHPMESFEKIIEEKLK